MAWGKNNMEESCRVFQVQLRHRLTFTRAEIPAVTRVIQTLRLLGLSGTVLKINFTQLFFFFFWISTCCGLGKI
jgi:hypothetical protein